MVLGEVEDLCGVSVDWVVEHEKGDGSWVRRGQGIASTEKKKKKNC